MSDRSVRWPWASLGGFLAIAGVAMVFVSKNGEALDTQIPYVIAFSMFYVVGALIASRDPHNRIGLLLMFGGMVTALSFFSGEVLAYALAHGQAGWWLVILGLINAYGWVLGILGVIVLLPLLFPDGHLPSRRWRPLLWLIVGLLVVLVVTLTFGQKTLTGSGELGVRNPFYVDAIGSLPTLDPFLGLMLPSIFAASVVSLILRFRRSTGVERQQIKWVAFGLAIATFGIVASVFSNSGSGPDTFASAFIGGLTYLIFPAAIGIAVLRFRLYDLDVVVKKTVVYAALAVFATLVYLGLVVGLGTWLGRGDSFLTMVAAVIVAVTFQPARTRLSRFANRMVYGRRATPYEVLTDFSERVGDTYAEVDVLPRMARVLGEGVGAERSDVWLVVGSEFRRVASWPSTTAPVDPVPVTNGADPAIPGMDRIVRVEQAGDVLGVLAVSKPPSDPISPADEKLIAGLGSQAGLVLRNVRLTEELKLRLEDLKAAQKRLVAAQDHERRRLERNIHDGAQQQLVALAVKARLARRLTERDPVKATEMLTQMEAETQQTLEDLRDLARGIYPPLLADKGLAEALTAQARKSAVAVEVVVDGVGRYPQEVEAAAYFSVLEALQNVAKYAGVGRASVTLAQEVGDLCFEVRDEGTGFDVSAIGYGTGLQGMADRLEALDGSLELTSAPGGGTTVRGRIPIPDRVPA